MTGALVIREVAVIASPVANRAGYHAIGACALGVSVTSATASDQTGNNSRNSRAWSIHVQ